MLASIDTLVSGFNVPPSQMEGLGYAVQLLVSAIAVAETLYAWRLAFDGVQGIVGALRNMYLDHKQAVLYRELQRNPQLWEETKRRYPLS